ncbi:hypothetical protein PA25_03620 [Pseudoalteromonas sp. A25]|uniref:prepilin-type N-terminal cleavage/methylation domain-containing protein n=1 Tax=Pseudoalteromonas sp. A25 TaxID=116092 RepID=UPI001260E069|nr:prepilin-type N-terminal cleavage/methylation domain-containing protein [Pseudoalteromonas sp. A25]BBN80377.1 hypothetical protein PA25_03620 [Pseudoalteromonas sp. A25]
MNKRVKLLSLRGFSLVELLISLAILSMLITTATFSYQMLLERWSKGLNHFDSNYQSFHRNLLLQSVIKGIFPYVVVNRDGSPSFFFIGDQDSLLAVTENGVFDDSFPEVFRLILQKNGDETFRLIYQGRSMRDFLLLRADQEIEFDNTLVLFDDINAFDISYIGWQNLRERTTLPVPKASRYSIYSGINNQLMPMAVEVRLKSAIGEIFFSSQYNTESFKELSPYFSEGM